VEKNAVYVHIEYKNIRSGTQLLSSAQHNVQIYRLSAALPSARDGHGYSRIGMDNDIFS
jgi:hypothetical protein